MTKEEFKQKLEEILPDVGYDPECAHGDAEDVLVEALTDLGYDCSLFEGAEFWYA
jgi:hypothetical protein